MNLIFMFVLVMVTMALVWYLSDKDWE